MADFISISSEGGRIGEMWWFNSNTKPRRFDPGHAPHIALEGIRLIQWGTFGLGRHVSILLEPLDGPH
jgi:hypothetical protein